MAKTATAHMMTVANKEVWVRAVMFFSAVGLLGYLWRLVHFNREQLLSGNRGSSTAAVLLASAAGNANTNEHELQYYYFSGGGADGENLGEVYTVYTCAILLFVGISVLWR